MSETDQELQDQLAAQRAQGDQPGAAATLLALGQAQEAAGHAAAALASFDEGLAIMRELEDRAGEATFLNSMAGVHYNAERPSAALALWEEVVPILRETGFAAGEAVTLANMTGPLVRDGRVPEAIACLERAIDLFHAGLQADAAGNPLAMYESALRQLRPQEPGTTPPPALPDDELQVALLALINTAGLSAKQEVLAAQADLLLSDAAAARVAQQIEEFSVSGDENIANALRFHQELLGQCREKGVQAGFAAMETALAAAGDPLQAALSAFINAPAWPESRRVLEAQATLLLSDAADQRLSAEIEAVRRAGNEEVADLLGIHREILRQCRRRGLPAVFADLEDEGQDA